MNATCRCQNHRPACSTATPSWAARAKEAAGFIVPGTLLTLLPKCPMCLAAYFALGTGITMSYGSARILMHSLTVLCIGTAALCVAKRLVNWSSKKQSFNLLPTQPQP